MLSTGSDGRLDVAAIDEYFEVSEHTRDIVFRDGDAVVTGGKQVSRTGEG